jgi:hypothetical protein
MLLRLFNSTQPGVILVIAVTMGLLWINAFMNPLPLNYSVYETGSMPLYALLKYLNGSNPLTGTFFSIVLLSFMSFLMVHFNTTHFFIGERTFLPAIIYILFSCVFIDNQILNPALPASVLLMLAMMRIMDSYRKPGTAFNYFDAGLLVGIGTLFYAGLIWFTVIIIAGNALLRAWNIKEITLSLIGVAVPLFITAGVFYITGKEPGLIFNTMSLNLFSETEGYGFGKLTVVILIILGLITLVSAGSLVATMNSKKIKTRKTFYLLLWMFFISLTIYFTLPHVSVEVIFLAAIPASYLISHYLIYQKKRLIPEVIFTGLLILILLKQILSFL